MTPSSTYRVQLHEGFGFRDAAALVPYLRALGVSHLYASPSLEAAPGSTHGYDVVDPTRLDAARGGEEGFAALRAALDAAGMGLVLDIVPNHVGLVLPENAWWWSVLRDGPDSPYAGHFDIAWGQGPTGRPRVLWPDLGAPLAELLEAGELTADVHDGELVLAVGEQRFPTRPGTAADHGLPEDPAAAAAVLREDAALLRAVVDDQHHELAHWRRANDELTHRRFFDIVTLGGVRVEDPAVFDDVHRRVLALVDQGAVDGLRIDHPDGLRDPAGYARDLRAAAPDAWIVFEKILEEDEPPRTGWPVDGTVGYEFLNLVFGLYVAGDSAGVLTALYDQLLGGRQDPVALVDRAKREVLADLFGSELQRLVDLLGLVAGEAHLDASPERLQRVLEELLVAFPVYRTYVHPGRGELTDEDRHELARAVAGARVALPEEPLLDLLADVLHLRRRSAAGDDLVLRFQQLSGPVMAKGIEDTVFYRYLRFAVANEVGGHPQHLGTDLDQFHGESSRRVVDQPATMLTTSTHDTKRSEDVRARLAVLSELPDRWVRAVHRLGALAAPHRGTHGPSPAHEYLLWQTVVGTWPITADRLVAYMVKAAREGKQSTSWLAPDEQYEGDLERFARGVLDDPDVVAVLEELLREVVGPGRTNALSQTLLRLTSPGVPDTYQGTELWDLSLVDPDNRRPVDHDQRAELLAWLTAGDGPRPPDEVLARMDEGVPKLHVVHRALQVRQAHAAAFGAEGGYTPLLAAGPAWPHAVAFLRGEDVAVVAPRLVVTLALGAGEDPWHGTTLALPDGPWHDALTGASLPGGVTPVGELLADFPVALLTRGPTA